MHCEVLVTAGTPPVITVGEPGAHGPATSGVHGMGVSAPNAAAVAAATVGFIRLVHAPNGLMFKNGTMSVIAATGWLPAMTRLTGRIVSGVGAIPNEHWITDPLVTTAAMAPSVRQRHRSVGVGKGRERCPPRLMEA